MWLLARWIAVFFALTFLSASMAKGLYRPDQGSCTELKSAALAEKEKLEQYFNNRIVRHTGREHIERVCILYRLWDVALHEFAVGLERCGNHPAAESMLQESMGLAVEITKAGCNLY